MSVTRWDIDSIWRLTRSQFSMSQSDTWNYSVEQKILFFSFVGGEDPRGCGRSFLGLYLTHPVGHVRGSGKSKSNLLYFPSFLFCSFRKGAAVLQAYTTDGEEGCSGVPTSGFNLSSEWFMKGRA